MKRNIIFILFGIILGITFILPLILFGILNAGNGAGLLVSAVFIFYGCFFEKVNLSVKKLMKKTIYKVLFPFFIILISAVVIFASVYSVKMIRTANNPPNEKTTVVVLGCKVKPSGPSLMLTTRLNATFSYLSENPDLVCVLSGGQGTDEHMSEAQAMKEWLIEKGIDEKRLYIEDNSTSTKENLSFSINLIREAGLSEKVTIITNEFHQYRAKLIAQNLGIESYSVSARTPFYLLPTYYIRELGGIIMHSLASHKKHLTNVSFYDTLVFSKRE